MSAENFDIVIQGGGPVGLASTAWCLQKFPEAKIVMLDRNPEDDTD